MKRVRRQAEREKQKAKKGEDREEVTVPSHLLDCIGRITAGL